MMQRRIISPRGAVTRDWEDVRDAPLARNQERLNLVRDLLLAYRNDLTVAVQLVHDDDSRTEFRLAR